jgi:hypothetical protein
MKRKGVADFQTFEPQIFILAFWSLYLLSYDLMILFLKLQYMNCNLNELATFTRYCG